MFRNFVFVPFSAMLAAGAMPGVALAQSSDFGRYGPHMWGGYGMIFGPLFMIAGLALAIWLAAALLRWQVPQQGSAQAAPQPRPTPLEILKERFAKGEIDRKEFDERKRALGE